MSFHFVIMCLAIANSEIMRTEASMVQEREEHIKNSDKQCNTSVCKEAVAKMLSSINYYADPCEEFHEYICGNQITDNKPMSKKHLGLLRRYFKKNGNAQSEKYILDFRRFYESCIAFDPTFDFIENMKFIKKYTSTNLTGVFIESILTQSMLFFDVGMKIGEEDGSYIFQIGSPGKNALKTELRDWSVIQQVENECGEHLEKSLSTKSVNMEKSYENFEKCKDDLMMKYAERYQKDMQFALGESNNNVALQDSLKFLKRMTVRHINNTDKCASIPINMFNKKYGVIEWKTFFEGLASKTFTGNELVEIYNVEFMNGIFSHMKNYDERGLVELLQEFSSFQFYTHFLRHYKDRTLFCMDLSQQLMPDVTNVILYDVKSSLQINNSFSNLKKIFDDVKNILKNFLSESSLDDDTKSSYEKKLSKLELGLIRSGDRNRTHNNYLSLVVTKNYMTNLQNLLKNYRRTLFSLVGKKSSAETLLNFFVGPFTNTPKTFYPSNFVVWHPPLYDEQYFYLSNYLGVAKLGLLLAQEVAKHFDPIGRLFRTGDVSTASNDYYSVIISNTEKILYEYYLKTPYTFHGTSIDFLSINGSHFINEMIADYTAFRISTHYFETNTIRERLPWIFNNITEEQIFIIAAAQEFCGRYSKAEFLRNIIEGRRLPFPIKIQNMMSNSPSFSKAFKCSDGSAMTLDSSVMVQFPYKSEAIYYEYEEPSLSNDF